MDSWCRYFPWWPGCGGGGGVAGPLGSPEMPSPLAWMQGWLLALNDAPEPPTMGDLSVLANALLAAGYAEEARRISREVLSIPAEFGASDDPLNQVQMQLIAARAEMALNNVDAAQQLIDALPERDTLRETLGKMQGLP